MSLLNRLRPKWQNSDPEVRAEAVRQLERDDVEMLTAVAQGDEDPRVRRIAVKKLDAPRLLLEIASTDDDEGLRAFALQRARHRLVQIASDERDLEESKRALELLSAPEDLGSVVQKAHFEELRDGAFERLDDDDVFAQLATTATDLALRARAFERITSPGALKTVILDEQSGDLATTALARLDDLVVLESIADHHQCPKSIRRAALTKLRDLAPPDHPIKVRERAEKFQALKEEIDTLQEASPMPDAEAIDELSARWSTLESEGPAPAELAEPFKARQAELTRAVEAAGARKQAEQEQTEAQRGREEELANICDTLDALEGAAIEPKIENCCDRFARIADAPPSEDQLTRRYHESLQAAKTRLAQWSSLQSTEQKLHAIVEEAEAFAESGDLTDVASGWRRIETKWQKLGSSDDASPTPVPTEVAARFARAGERLEARIAKQREDQSLSEQSTLKRLEEQVARLEALAKSEDLRLKEADQAARETVEFLKTMGALPKTVSRKKARQRLTDAREALLKRSQEVRELESWKRWANVDIQEGLIQKIEALKGSKDLPKISKEMRTIHEDWKKAGAVPAEKAEELWTRYKATRDELKARCDEFFKKQKQERVENLAKKRLLCEQVEALQDSESWSETADKVKEIQASWKKIGPVPRKHSDSIWKRFRGACDHFFERRKQHFDHLKDGREENFKKKEALCERAEAIQNSTDWRQTSTELKQLQSEWRTIGAVPRKKSDQVWKRFRKACDHFFDRFKRRDEVEAEDKLEKRRGYVQKLQDLGKQDALNDAAAQEVLSLWGDWRKLGVLPESESELQDRFDQALGTLLSGSTEAFLGSELDPAANRKKREKLCQRLETLVGSFRPTAVGGSGDELTDLAARLKDALASNTMMGHSERNRKPDMRNASEEASRLRSSWMRTAPIPGEEGRALEDRFQKAYSEFLRHRSESRPSKPRQQMSTR